MKLAVVIMRIEHIAMYVNDLEATKESFIKYKVTVQSQCHLLKEWVAKTFHKHYEFRYT